MTAKAIRIDCREADEKSQRHGSDRNATDQLFGKAELAAEEAVYRSADQW
jgi:hypothetical protein